MAQSSRRVGDASGDSLSGEMEVSRDTFGVSVALVAFGALCWIASLLWRALRGGR